MLKSTHPLYGMWCSMKQRCYNPKNTAFPDYGGRGISVCDEWKKDFLQFVSDIGPRPNGFEIDRIDNDENYTRDNCRWVTHKNNMQNRRNTVYITIGGVRYLLSALSEESGMKSDTIRARAEKGMTYAEVMDKTIKYVFHEGLSLGGRASGDARLAKTHCKRGHERNRENTGQNNKGMRRCRVCHREREAARRAAK